ARVAAHKVGVPESHAEWIRSQIVRTLAREVGQRGTSEENRSAAAEARGFLQSLVDEGRAAPERTAGHLASLLAAEVDGRSLTDAEVVADMMTLLVTGADTTEFGVVGTVYYLTQHPEQLDQVLADRSLVPGAF